MKTTQFLVVALLLIGCQTPAPYDPGAECPKVAYCGQCASHGACAWCGDPSDGSRGQCVAVGRAECAAPSAWAKTPDRCAPPPDDDKGANAAAASAGPSDVERRLGREKYASIKASLTRAFPGSTITDEVIDGVAAVLAGPPPLPGGGGAKTMEKAPITRHIEEKEHRLYLGRANHHRVRSPAPASAPMQSQFALDVPMVRVTLPEALTDENATIDTEMGYVDLRRDHLLGSVDLIAAKYGGAEYLGARPARVDLITPPRSVGWRFGAIALYLGYRSKADRGPSFYMFEAGTATGDAKMIYFSPDMKPISNVTSYYQPTPFVTMRNTYSGSVTMAAAPNEDEPEQMVVESRAPGAKDPYITITVRYRRAKEIELPMPTELTVDAAARVALIAKAMGLPSGEPLEGALADLAKTFHWIEAPRYIAPEASPSSSPTSTSTSTSTSTAPLPAPR